MMLAMSEVVFKVIPLSFESIVVLIFNLPSGTTRANNGNDRISSDEMTNSGTKGLPKNKEFQESKID